MSSESSRQASARWSRACAGVGLIAAALLLGFAGWRAALPSNRYHRPIDIRLHHPDGFGFPDVGLANGFDDAVTVATARNFARDGFLRTHFLPNRARAPLANLFDITHTWCEPLRKPEKLIEYVDREGHPMPMHALNGDCIYTHYPPLADWIFGTLAWAGVDSILDYKWIAILVHFAFLLLFYLWLRREVSEWAALAGVAVMAASPGILQWIDSLYYQSFQYLFLTAGLLTWTAWLRRPRWQAFAATWVLFFCESLVSYELIFFFGLMLVALPLVERKAGERWRLGPLAIQACAPVSAFLLHLGLRISLFGPARTWKNLAATYSERTLQGVSEGVLGMMRVHHAEKLMPLYLMGAALLAVVVVRRATGAGLRRPLLLLAMLLAGGWTFTLVFPGTAVRHYWMMYRHLLPFMMLLLALVADALVSAVHLLWTAWRRGTWPPVRSIAAAATACVLGAACLGWSAVRDGREVAVEVEWNLARNRYADPANLAQRYIDVAYWKESLPDWDYRFQEPVDGRRVNRAAPRFGEFRIHAGAVSHYEIWWLEEVPLRRIEILTTHQHAEALLHDCFLSFFQSDDFRRVSPALETRPFVPAPGEPEPPVPYEWARFTLPSPQNTRVMRLTCSGAHAPPLHEIAAYAE